MAMYFDGYGKARANVEAMTTDERLRYIDHLYGREKLSDEPTDDDIRYEALDQCRREFTDTSSQEYEDVQFWVTVGKLQNSNRRFI